MMRQTGREPTAHDLVKALFRHQKKTLATFVLTMAAVVGGVLLWPRTYESEAKLFVRIGRETVTLDPTATTGKTIEVDKTQEGEIASVVEVLSSRRIAELAVARVGADVILYGQGSDAGNGGAMPQALTAAIHAWEQFLAPLRDAAKQLDPVGDEEKAATELREKLSIWAPKNSSVISLRFEADSPEVAQQTVTAVVDSYLEEHARVNRTAGSFDFFVEQTQLLADQLAAATAKLRDAKNEFGLVSLAGQRTLLEQELAAVQVKLVTSESDLAASKAAVDQMEKIVAGIAPQVTAQRVSGLPNEAADGMRQQLYDLEIREKELLAKFTPEHPEVKAVREQVKEVESILSRQAVERTQTTTAINPTHQTLHQSLLAERSRCASLDAEAKSLQGQLVELQGELRRLNAHEVGIVQLQREVDLLENNYRTYANNLEQARVDQALESQRISNVNVVQAATFVAKPVSPKRGLCLGLGLVMAFCLAVGVAISAQWLDRSLQDAEEVERRLDVPVLTVVPCLSRRHLTWK